MAGSERTVTVSAAGRVALPEAVSERLGWGKGTRLVVEVTAEGVLTASAAAVFAATRVEDVFECLGPVERAKSMEEMSISRVL